MQNKSHSNYGFNRRKIIFLFCLLLPLFFCTKLQAFNLDSVKSFFDKLDDLQNYVEIIEVGKPAQLPMGVRTTIGAVHYDLLFAEARFKSTYTEVAAYLRITIPNAGQKNTILYFGADNIKMTKDGGYMDKVKLALLGDYDISGKGDALILRLKGAEKNSDGLPPTYAEIDCEGFKELSIGADLIFSDKYVRPVLNDKVQTNKKLTVSFRCSATDIYDILAHINIPEFEVVGFGAWRFSAEDAVIDMSELRNDTKMNVYAGEVSGGFQGEGDITNLWTGVYISKIKVALPTYFKNTKTGKSPAITAEHLWFDENGFSGKIGGEDILHLDRGNIGGWGFSIDKLSLSFAANELRGGQLDGKLLLPIDDENAIVYSGQFLADEKLSLNVKMDKKLKMSLWKADNINLAKTSYIEIVINKEKEVKALACLTGSMSVNPFQIDTIGEDTKQFDFGTIGFTNMKIQNTIPYFKVQKFSYDQELKISGFPASVSGLELRSPKDDKAQLDFDINIHLTSQSDGGFKGSLGLSVEAQLIMIEERQKWAFDKVLVQDIKVDASNAAFKLKGNIKIYRDDKRYGNGFKGDVSLHLIPLSLEIRTKLMFGSMPTFRYWYADGLADFGNLGIPVFPGFVLSGFGGGAYQRMKIETDYESNVMGNRETQTGLRYIPDSTISLGLKAFVVGATQASDLLNVELALSMGFNQNNGIDHITFQGLGKFLKGMPGNYFDRLVNQVSEITQFTQESTRKKQEAAAFDAAITAAVFMTYDVSNKSLYAMLETYMNMGVLRGSGTGGSVGKCEMYFDKTKWHIYLGTPEKRLGVRMKLGPINLSTGLYLMTGHDIPPMPMPNPKTLRLLKTQDMRNLEQGRDINSIRSGQGFSMGANLGFNTGEINLIAFYASLESDLGFDVSLRKYGTLSCKGSSELIGIDGWYANGQAYSYFYGAIGLRLNLFGAKRNLPILEGEMASLLEAQLPNPTWFAGKFAFNYSILNGLIRGYCNFKFELGDKCELYETAFVDGQKIIADVKPDEKSLNVDVFAIPQVAFNLPIDSLSTSLDGQKKKIRIHLDKYTLTDAGLKIGGLTQWNTEKNVVSYKSKEILPAKRNLNLEVQISVQEWIDNQWKALKDDKGQNYIENKKINFTTALGPDSIPVSNIQYAYPVLGQSTYYVGEGSKSYIKLKQGQSYLFDNVNVVNKIYIISDKDTLSASFSYNKTTMTLSWIMPTLQRQRHYTLQVRTEAKYAAALNTEASQNYTQLLNNQGSTIEQRNLSLTNTQVQLQASRILLSYTFSTSNYSKMADKIKAISISKTYRTPYMVRNTNTGMIVESPDIHYLQAHMNPMEPFDVVELRGHPLSGNKPLIRARAVLSNNIYFRDYINPLIYAQYPYLNMVKFARAEGDSLLPVWAVYVSSFYDYTAACKQYPWIYYIPLFYKNDFNSVLTQLADASTKSLAAYRYFSQWANKAFIPIKQGYYEIQYQYVFPNGTLGSACTEVLYNSVK